MDHRRICLYYYPDCVVGGNAPHLRAVDENKCGAIFMGMWVVSVIRRRIYGIFDSVVKLCISYTKLKIRT